jgi:hypothetical protein
MTVVTGPFFSTKTCSFPFPFTAVAIDSSRGVFG